MEKNVCMEGKWGEKVKMGNVVRIFQQTIFAAIKKGKKKKDIQRNSHKDGSKGGEWEWARRRESLCLNDDEKLSWGVIKFLLQSKDPSELIFCCCLYSTASFLEGLEWGQSCHLHSHILSLNLKRQLMKL